MILSMTGYGTVLLQREEASLGVEVRTVNHRFLDVHIRLSREYGFLETEISQLVRDTLRRGRVDVNVTVQAAYPPASLVNLDTARSYLDIAARLKDEFHLADTIDLKTLITLPGVLQNQGNGAADAASVDSNLREFVLEGVRDTLKTVLQMREREGKALESEMRMYLEGMRQKIAVLRGLMPSIVVEYGKKLEERLQYLLPQVSVDAQRLAQEVALLSERSDISEEVTRLESHVEQYAGVLDHGREVGKKLDFLLQEMQREVNTTLSKTGHLEVTRLGIALKADVEKLREQVQNVE